MKKFKRIMALVIAMAMVLGLMSMAAFGADPDAKVTVDGLTEGDVAHFYKVVEWQNADETHSGGWVLTSAFGGANGLTAADLKEIAGDPETGTPGKISAEMAGKIARLASGDGTAVTVEEGETTAELTISGAQGAKSGLFLVLITPADPDTVYNPVFVASDYDLENTSAAWTIVEGAQSYSDNAATKKSKLTVTKEATTTEDNWDDKKPNTTAVGDTVSFSVNTTIPGYGTVYEEPHFVMKDSLVDLKLVEESVTLVAPEGLSKYNAETNVGSAADAWQYKVETAEDGYTITFNPSYLNTLATPTAVNVTYNAIVTTSALKNVNTEKNEVTIEYSHNPNDEDDYNVKKDTTQHYTFTLDADALGGYTGAIGKSTSELVKVALSPDGTPLTNEKVTSQITESHYVESPLAGAVFGLYTDEECTNAYIPKNANGTAGTEPFTVTTGSDGRMTIPGLDAGTYYIKEISAPEGFIKDMQAHEIVITAVTKKQKVTEYYKDGEWSTTQSTGAKEVTYETDVLDYYTVTVDGVNTTNTSKHTFNNPGTSTDVTWVEESSVELPSSLPNTRGTELPSTGGIGTTIFYVVGAILVIGAGVILITRRRMDA